MFSTAIIITLSSFHCNTFFSTATVITTCTGVSYCNVHKEINSHFIAAGHSRVHGDRRSDDAAEDHRRAGARADGVKPGAAARMEQQRRREATGASPVEDKK